MKAAIKTRSYRDLLIWQRSMQLVKDVYAVTSTLPKHELYGICSQAQRSAVSIPSNIAEGQERSSTKEFIQFLNVAKGSAAELETQLVLIADIYTMETAALVNETFEIRRMINALIVKLKVK